MPPTGNPAEAITHRSDIEVSFPVGHCHTAQQVFAAKALCIDEIGKKFSVTVIKQPVGAHHQHATFITHEVSHRTKGRFKFLQNSLRRTTRHLTAVTRFPEGTLGVDKNMAEVVCVALGIAFQLMVLTGFGVKTEQTVTSRTY